MEGTHAGRLTPSIFVSPRHQEDCSVSCCPGALTLHFHTALGPKQGCPSAVQGAAMC